MINDVLKQDEKLPSVRTLAQQLSINPNTIQKAYRELESQGYIYSVKGKGSFVNHMLATDHSEEKERMKTSLKKDISEALYLGMTEDELMELVREVKRNLSGGEGYDSDSRRP
ncbi:GntR family transcriptional regulator [Gracilibacillus halophilus YIM-C55.5]|uniref:GntR family transcriptional regulator n=1 Tax=Gracilibacillus halophilus YIM-C55.5 TaxID=1308866 RepID=N4WD40_9BACI|nr:GntR family transcriptional regulator [Gracilibacillus halophilus YIM-C55.5]